MIKYAYTILYVPDVEKTVSFYEQAFGFQRKFVTPEQDYGELVSGETTIAFASLELANSNLKSGFTESKPTDKPMGVELAFATEQPQVLMERAKEAGATVAAELKTKPWGQKVGYVRDINGFLVEICTLTQED